MKPTFRNLLYYKFIVVHLLRPVKNSRMLWSLLNSPSFAYFLILVFVHDFYWVYSVLCGFCYDGAASSHVPHQSDSDSQTESNRTCWIICEVVVVFHSPLLSCPEVVKHKVGTDKARRPHSGPWDGGADECPFMIIPHQLGVIRKGGGWLIEERLLPCKRRVLQFGVTNKPSCL